MLSPGMSETAIPPAPPGLDEPVSSSREPEDSGAQGPAIGEQCGMEVGANGSELRPVFAACPICRSRILMRFAQWAQVLSWSPCRARKSRAVPLLSPSCPAPRMRSANPMSAPSSNFRVAKFQIPLSWLPLVGFGERVGPVLPLISATIFDL